MRPRRGVVQSSKPQPSECFAAGLVQHGLVRDRITEARERLPLSLVRSSILYACASSSLAIEVGTALSWPSASLVARYGREGLVIVY
jgi:hypothetical protein